MVRTVNTQIGTTLNQEIETTSRSSYSSSSLSAALARIRERASTLPAESDIADQENVYADSPPSYDSLSQMDQTSNSPTQPTTNETTLQNTEDSAVQNGSSEQNPANPVEPTTPRLTGIEACIDRLIRSPVLRQNSKDSLDTLIFIDRLCLHNRDLEDQLQEYYSNQPILVERAKLEALNSPYFNKCFSGMYQTRKWKFLGAKAALCTLPKGIKYIISMTPENEGMEAVQAIQDLSCPFGVLHWKKSNDRWGNRKSLVAGLDENDVDIDANDISREYSLVRHVKSIERFMAALQGHDPQLDTAPKLYSAVMVSKPWGIQTQHPLTDYVARWLCDAESNSKFIDAYPEVVLKMADVLKCAPLCKDAFALLVGEAALEAVLTRNLDDQQTVYERVRGDIEEDWLSRVQHARNSFEYRIKNAFDCLAGEEMEWVSSLTLVRNMQLKAELHKEEIPQFERFLILLKQFIRGSIYKFLCYDYEDMTDAKDRFSTAGDDLYPREIEETVWGTLRAPERVFTIKFWQALTGCYVKRSLQLNASNLAVVMSHHITRGLSSICIEYAGGHLMETVLLSTLVEALPESSRGWKSANSSILKITTTKSAFARVSPISSQPHSEVVTSSSHPWQNEMAEDALLAEFRPNRGLTLPEKPNHRSPGYALMFGTCSSTGCLNQFYAGSISSYCDTCRWQYCQTHIDQDDHDCVPPSRHLAFDGQPGPLGTIYPQSMSVETNNELEGTTEEEWNDSRLQLALPIIREILAAAMRHISEVGRAVLSNVHGGNLSSLDDASRIAHTLACLSEDELKYLPLWAEGLDDGTGGVFGDHIPAASEDSAGLGPGGRRLGSRSEGSNYSFVSETVDSTVNTSTVAHDGYRDTLPRGRVVAMDDVDSSSEGGWSYIQDAIGDGKGKARAFTPAESSQAASTLGDLEQASVIDLGIQSGTDSYDQLDSDMDVRSIGSSGVSSPRTVGAAEDHDDDILDDCEGAEDDFDLDGDDDMDMMFDDELAPTEKNRRATTVARESSIPTTNLHEQKSMAHVSYAYKDEHDDDLMTRL